MVQAKKRFSQNFLQDETIINQIVQAMVIQKHDHIIEIGPGQGALTKKIASQCHRFLALEIDADLIAPLTKRFADQENTTILQADALTFAYNQQEPFRLVSNLPYHLSTALIRKFISNRQHIIDMHLMMQKEVAERLLCTYGKARGWLSVMIELLCEAEYLFDVPNYSFYPQPKIMSAVIRLQWKKSINPSNEWLAFFEEMLMQAFNQKRKTLYNNFARSKWKLQFEHWSALGIDASLRAEQLELEGFIKLHQSIKNAII